DLAVLMETGSGLELRLYLNAAMIHTTTPDAWMGVPTGVRQIATADVDGDGKSDVLLNGGAQPVFVSTYFFPGLSPFFLNGTLAIGDVGGTGHPNLVWSSDNILDVVSGANGNYFVT